MRKIKFEKFKEKIINLPEDESIWKMKCKNDMGIIYTLSFSKHTFEAENGGHYPFVVYSYPMTLDAGFIQQDIDNGWDENIKAVWDDITETCELIPFED